MQPRCHTYVMTFLGVFYLAIIVIMVVSGIHDAVTW